MDYTTNYQLPQWVKSDRIMMDDFNDANAKLDAALKSQADALNALEDHLGQCKWEHFIYTGTGHYGEDHPTVLTFPQQPLLAVVVNSSGEHYCFLQGAGTVTPGDGYIYCRWTTADDGVTLSWYSNGSAVHQFNTTATYHVFVAYAIQ